MTTREDILERLAYADALGHGPQTSALIAEAVSWADALGDEDLRIAARLALTEAYQQGNEAWKALSPFAWNLGRYQRHPEAFGHGAQVRTLHWHFKWAVAVARRQPQGLQGQGAPARGQPRGVLPLRGRLHARRPR